MYSIQARSGREQQHHPKTARLNFDHARPW